MPFQICNVHGWGGVTEFIYDPDVSAFLKTELVGFGVKIPLGLSPQSQTWTHVYLCILRASDPFLQCKK